MTDIEKTAMEQRINELCQQIVQLKSDHVYQELDKCLQCSIIDNFLKVQDENIELRKFIAILYKCVRGILRDLAPSCADLSMEGCGMDCTENGENCCMVLLEQRIHELGIETG
jgi:hypothetical protein